MILVEENADAYKSYFGKDIVLTTPNAGFEWIKAIYENDLIVGTSDTTIAENVGIKGQNEKRENPPWACSYSPRHAMQPARSRTQAGMEMEPFAGFYYSLYALMAKSAKNPMQQSCSSSICSPRKDLLLGDPLWTYSANPTTHSGRHRLPLRGMDAASG
jgi:iron(III) transport system substrate-binding protein